MEKSYVHFYKHLLLTLVRLDFGLSHRLRNTRARSSGRNCLIAG